MINFRQMHFVPAPGLAFGVPISRTLRALPTLPCDSFINKAGGDRTLKIKGFSPMRSISSNHSCEN